MMLSELQIQAEIVKSCNKIGYGQKMSNKNLAGVPDLFLAINHFGNAFVEIKLLTMNSDLVLLTKLQSETIKKMQRAGIWAGVAAIRDLDRGNFEVYTTTNCDEATHLGPHFSMSFKNRGKEWPILALIYSMRQDAA